MTCGRLVSQWEKWRAGFTLVEMLVSVTLTVLIVTFLVQYFDSIARIWHRSDQQTDAFREARAALRFMSRDLSKALAIPTPSPSASSGSNAIPGFTIISGTSITSGTYSGDEATALIPLSNPEGKSDVCQVSYYCQWDASVNAFALMRNYSNSNVTYSTLLSDAGLPAPSASPSPTAAPAEVLASYVWAIHFKPFDNTGNYINGTNGYPKAPYTSVQSFTSPLPAGIEISFATVSANATQRLKAQNISQLQWIDPWGTTGMSSMYKMQILPVMQVFKTRVYFTNYYSH